MEKMGRLEELSNFYKGKKVFITGHTGFKGAWLSYMLIQLGADVAGYSLPPASAPCLFSMLHIENEMRSHIGDIRDKDNLLRVMREEQPEIVFHLAAQPIVRTSYEDPVYTYETNVLGTVYICEAIRQSDSVKSFLNVTTDKVYKNNEWERGYKEEEPLDGYDPYSNSKSCSELVTHSYINSFYREKNLAVSTARAGNVIGGGDFAKDRIIPDCVRAVLEEKEMLIRNPYAIRPFQHVLEPLAVYMMIAKRQYEDIQYAGFYNVGPDDTDCVTTSRLVELFEQYWNADNENHPFHWSVKTEENAPHEANYLKLDCTKLKKTFDWKPTWNIDEAIKRTVQWTNVYKNGGNIRECMKQQIQEFFD